MTPTTAPLLSPAEIATRAANETPYLRFAATAFAFRDRGQRLRQLAAGHPMRDYLMFAASLAEAQQAVLQAPRHVTLPEAAFLGDAAHRGEPPLAFPHWPLHDEWLQDLHALLDALAPNAPAGVANVITQVRSLSGPDLRLQAERLLRQMPVGLDLAMAPLVGAALQVYWTRLVDRTQKAFPDLAFGRVDHARHCPCCGSTPVASVTRIGATEAGARYLHCSLCQTEWHWVRIQCSHCETSQDVTYQSLESITAADGPAYTPPAGAVRAECCGACGHYLKIMDMSRDAHVDPVADDLASVTLDLLVSETGLQRHGVNYLLLWGDDAPEEPLAGPP